MQAQVQFMAPHRIYKIHFVYIPMLAEAIKYLSLLIITRFPQKFHKLEKKFDESAVTMHDIFIMRSSSFACSTNCLMNLLNQKNTYDPFMRDN